MNKLIAVAMLVFAAPQGLMAEVPYLRCFVLASQKHQVPLDLLIGIARIESGFNPDARSPANAHGIMQVRWPLTARHLGVRRIAELYNPCVNIEIGASYVSELLRRYHNNTVMAIAAYNYGPTRLHDETDIPAGVLTYVQNVQKAANTIPAPASRKRRTVNTFSGQQTAERYAQTLARLVPGASVAVQELPGRSWAVVLDETSLSRAGLMLISRMLD